MSHLSGDVLFLPQPLAWDRTWGLLWFSLKRVCFTAIPQVLLLWKWPHCPIRSSIKCPNCTRNTASGIKLLVLSNVGAGAPPWSQHREWRAGLSVCWVIWGCFSATSPLTQKWPHYSIYWAPSKVGGFQSVAGGKGRAYMWVHAHLRLKHSLSALAPIGNHLEKFQKHWYLRPQGS